MGRALLAQSTKQGSWEFVETEAAIAEPAWISTRSSACYGCWLDVLGSLVTVGMGVSLTLLPVLGTHFLLGCLSQHGCEHLCLVLLYLPVPCSVNVPGRSVLFWGGGDEKGVE